MIVWLDGQLIDAEAVRIDPGDRGLTLGDGLFETIAVRGGNIALLAAHLARLRHGCAVLRLPYPDADCEAALRAVLDANKMTDAVLRLTLTRGAAPRGLLPPAEPRPALLISAAPLPPPAPAARCVIAAVTRRNQSSPLCRVKSLNYLDNILARQEAAARGCDEAIMLNTQGRVAGASAANLFIVKDSEMVTPPIEDGALPGCMRALIMEKTGARERSLTPGDLAAADEIFLTNSLGIRSVAELDGKTFLSSTARDRAAQLADLA